MNLKKLIPFLLTTVMLVSTAACGDQRVGQPEPAAPRSGQGASDLRTVKLFGPEYRAFSWLGASTPEVPNHHAIIALNEDLAARGLRLEWEAIPNDSYAMALQMRIASNDKYGHLVNGSRLTEIEAVSYGRDGYFQELHETIANYDPARSIMNFIEQYFGSSLNIVTTEDGKMFWLPYMVTFMSVDGAVNHGTILATQIRKDWLDTLGIEYKYEYSTDEFYEMLKAFRENDMNGNGLPDENIGVSFADFGATAGLNVAFGLADGLGKGIERTNGANEYEFVWDSPLITEFLSYLNLLYEEGIYDLDLLADGAEVRMRNENRGAAFYTYADWNASDQDVLGVDEAYYASMRLYYQDPSNSIMMTQSKTAVYGSKYMIPSNLTEDETQGVVDLLAYCFSDRYFQLLCGGVEGIGFIFDEYGDMEYLFDQTFPQDLIAYDWPLWFSLSGNLLPNMWINRGSVKKLNEVSVPEWQAENDVRSLFNYEYRFTRDGTYNLCREAPAYSIPTAQESEVLERVTNTLTTYSQELFAAFVRGEANVSDLPRYRQEMTDIGADEFIAVMKARYNRAK